MENGTNADVDGLKVFAIAISDTLEALTLHLILFDISRLLFFLQKVLWKIPRNPWKIPRKK
jgi:hypothetical protein